VFSPALALYLVYRGLRQPAYLRRMTERFGFLPSSIQSTSPAPLWFHAVSVGEALSLRPLLRALRRQHPHIEMFLSTATLAGRESAERSLAGLVDGVFFAPFDYRSMVRRVLRRLRPAALIVMETEIWPNLYREAKRAGASLVVVNGRISDRALPRYRRWSALFRHVLRWADAIFAQSEEDARRYTLAGAPSGRVRAVGNLKYDFDPPGELAAELRAMLSGQVWVAASTSAAVEPGDPDEDDAVIAAYRALAPRHPDLLLVLAPRRPERFDEAAEKLRRAGVSFARRSRPAPVSRPGVLLLDSIGELAGVFECASVVFMGGTLAHRGGHNILEPAFFGKPVVLGPHMENFAEIAQEFTAAGAVVRIGGPDELAPAVERLLAVPGDVGGRARALAQARRGVADRLAREVLDAAARGVPNPLRTWPARAALRPLACAWAAGHRVNIWKTRPHALATKVISVGALTIGGAGKTPLVAHLAERLENAAILTRGYRRQASAPLIVPRGGSAPVRETGDEAQIYIRRAIAHVGIGADRLAVGREMERTLRPAVFLLDDGFQHFRLKRDEDIVLIDALDPAGGGLVPLGRRREPLDALARATAVVIARAEGNTAGVEAWIRRYNAQAPIFRSFLRPSACGALPGKVGAFCGLGSPRSFWRTLRRMGFDVVWRRAFADHHVYGAEELEACARQAAEAGAQALVTTEKDMMNIARPPGALPLAPILLALEIENEAALLERLR
jgi:3-deoxy-D-manno-octulosonic-acid transferase